MGVGLDDLRKMGGQNRRGIDNGVPRKLSPLAIRWLDPARFQSEGRFQRRGAADFFLRGARVDGQAMFRQQYRRARFRLL